MLHIKNPNYVAPGSVSFNAHRVAVLSFVANLPQTQRYFSFDDIRDALGHSAEVLPDGHIQQILIDADIMSGNKSVQPAAPAAPVVTSEESVFSWLDFIA